MTDKFSPDDTRAPLHGVRIWLILAAVAAVGVGLWFAWSSAFVAHQRAALAVQRAQSLPAESARDELRAAVRLDPENAEARHQLALADLALGDWELAFLQLESMTELRPGDPGAWTALAELMIKTGLFQAPEAALDRAIDLAPARADARAMRAELRFRMGRSSGASTDARAAATADAKYAGLLAPTHRPPPVAPERLRAEVTSGHDRLAAFDREHWPGRLARLRQALEVTLRQQKWSDAERIVDNARSSYPETAFVPFLAGILELARGQPKTAERQFREALAAAPRSRVVMAALAKAWSAEESPGVASRRLAQLADRDSSFAFARGIAARAAMDAHDPGEAEKALARATQDPAAGPPQFRELAEFYLRLDRASDAMDVLRRAHERLPQDTDTQLMLADVLAQQGSTRECIAFYEALLARRPDLDVAAYRLAAALATQGGPTPRLRELLALLRGDSPAQPLLIDALGWARFAAGETAPARALLETAVQQAPEEPSLHYHLAVLYLRTRLPEKAHGELDAALASNRPFPERLEALRLLRESAPDQASVRR